MRAYQSFRTERYGSGLEDDHPGTAYEQARLRFELAEAVRARREELGWSQRQLAERAGMTQPGIARFEAGGTTPTLPLLERLAAALGLTLTVSLAPAAHRSA
jgi:HTH-type transcriptional regulator / antitoxin HipB